MEFVTRYTFAVVVLFAALGVVHGLHVAGRAYWLHCVVKNARGHQDWLEFKKCHR